MMRFLIYRESSSCWVCCETGCFEWVLRMWMSREAIWQSVDREHDELPKRFDAQHFNLACTEFRLWGRREHSFCKSACSRGRKLLDCGLLHILKPRVRRKHGMGWQTGERVVYVGDADHCLDSGAPNLSEHRKSRITGSGCGTWQRRHVPAFDQYQSWRLHLRPHWPSSHCRWSSTILKSWSRHCSSVG